MELDKNEKEQMCEELAQHLPHIRSLLNLSQTEMGLRCGFSRSRISLIENKVTKMTWAQLTSIAFLVAVNQRTKEYFYANRLFGPRFLQYMQQKDENIPPDVNISVRSDLVMSYTEFSKFIEAQKTRYSGQETEDEVGCNAHQVEV